MEQVYKAVTQFIFLFVSLVSVCGMFFFLIELSPSFSKTMVNSFLLQFWDYECGDIVIPWAVGCQWDSSIPGTYRHALN